MSDLVIGIEVHVQLLSATKMFCGCKNSFGDEPNTNVCPVCLGLPGALPMVNEKASEMGLQLALALNCKINEVAPYYRKNYFYPDLPKGYQITQYATPLGQKGSLEFPFGKGKKRVDITRIHLEEDAGKMFHSGDITKSSSSLVDYNRCGAPLAEIVTEPCIETPEEAQAYLFALRNLVRFIGISTGNMEEGALRCDVNVSVKNPDGSFGTKVEVKNLNSFRSARRALEFEAKRQRDLIAKGGQVTAETRHFIESTGETAGMRSKEELNDYRYFPEPDLPPMVTGVDQIKKIRQEMPKTPGQIAEKFEKEYGLSQYDSGVLTQDKETTVFFEECVKNGASPKKTCSFLTVEIQGYFSKEGLSLGQTKLTPKLLSELVKLVDSNQITNQSAKTIIPDVVAGASPEKVAKERNLIVIEDESAIIELVRQVIENNPKQVEQYKQGKTALSGFFIGQVLKASCGKAQAETVKRLVEEALSRL